MEYSVKVTVVPTEKVDKYTARVFITASENGLTVGTEKVCESSLYTPSPRVDTDPIEWVNMVLLLTRSHLSDAKRNGVAHSSETLMGELFEHQGHFIN